MEWVSFICETGPFHSGLAPHLRCTKSDYETGPFHSGLVHPTEVRTSISPSSAVELNTTSAIANYVTEAENLTRSRRYAVPCGMDSRGIHRQYNGSCEQAVILTVRAILSTIRSTLKVPV
ncbi:unnamed protein product [Timema podura]|uniref:Uncharacterized protein n=1 Tax=Timema podura TaxID=61482 RepID=A0ABN7P1L0_TIMPD|nr:unnamed protein product [Timema podura]